MFYLAEEYVKTKPLSETLRKIKFCSSKPVNTIQLYIFNLFHSPNGETCNKMKPSVEKPKHVVCQHFSCSRVKWVVRLHVEEGSFLTPPKQVTPPTWGPPPSCKQALTVKLRKSWTPGNFRLHLIGNFIATH